MNKANKYLFITIIIVCSLIIISLYVTKKTTSYKEAEKVIDEVLKSEGYQLLYIGSKECEACSKELPQIESLIKNYNFGMYYIDLDNLSDSKVSKIISKLKIYTTKFNVPSLAVFKDGKYVDILSGLKSSDAIFDFLQKNSIINEEASMYINYLDLDSYNDLIASNENQIIALGSFFNDESNETQVALWKVAKENNIKINYLMLPNLTEEEGSKFESSLDYFENNDVGIPMILIVRNKEVIASSLENFDEEGYIEFFKENGLM